MCGVFGVFNSRKATEITYMGLHAIQSRATEYAGIVSSDGHNLFRLVGPGIVQDVFSQADLDQLRGLSAVGHIRYSTVEDNPKCDNAQPLVGPFGDNEIAIAHNGNIINCSHLRGMLKHPDRLKTNIDTEIVLRLICESKEEDTVKRIYGVLRHIRGTYSLIIMYNDVMIAVRDPWGNRPLSLGRKDQSWYLSSENIAFENLFIETVREIDPGEIVVITKAGLQSHYFDENSLSNESINHQRAFCKFELLYYSNPGSVVFGQSVAKFQLDAGTILWQEHPVPEADIVVGVPDSAMFHAQGYAQAGQKVSHNLSLARGLLRSHFIGRTFIQPNQWLRDLMVSKKFAPIRYLVEDKIVVLIDDSIVRLTTMPGVVKLLRWVGARQVHGRIVTPMIMYPCLYGIDTPSHSELSAARLSKDKMMTDAGLDSLEFLSLSGLMSLVPNSNDFCYACMTNNYSISSH